MNYLAHIYISRKNALLLTGSFIADSFKGTSYKSLPEGIIHGIVLHRMVDSFTDRHTDIRTLVKYLAPKLGKYTPVAVDVFGDYYLASHFDTFADMPLRSFEQYAYIALQAHIYYIPMRYRRMVQAIGYKGMLQQYADTQSLEYVFKRLQKRIQYPNNLKEALDVLNREQGIIFKHFDSFFPELLQYAQMQEALLTI